MFKIKSHYLVVTAEETTSGQRINSYWVCSSIFANFKKMIAIITDGGKVARTVLSFQRLDIHICHANEDKKIDNTEAINKTMSRMEEILNEISKLLKMKPDSESVPEPDFTMFSEKEIEQRLARYSTERDTHKYNIGERVEVVKVLYGNSPINSKVGKFARIYAFAGLDAEGTPEYFLSFENRLDGYCYRETEISDENVTKETSPEHDRHIEELTKDE